MGYAVNRPETQREYLERLAASARGNLAFHIAEKASWEERVEAAEKRLRDYDQCEHVEMLKAAGFVEGM